MIKDVLDNIKYECKECINMKNGEKIDIKSKVIITRGFKERFIIDSFH